MTTLLKLSSFLMLSSKNCHMFLKKCALSQPWIFFYSYVFIREPLARHSSLWRCEIVRAGSSRMSLASKETPPRCYLLLLVAYAECPSWIFRKRRREKFSGLIAVSAKARDMTRRKREKEGPETVTRRVLDSSGFRCLCPVEISAPVRLIFHANSRAEFYLGAALDSGGVTQRDGNISRITVGWGTLGISRETPLEHGSDEII